MSQNVPETENASVTQEEVDLAEAQEQAELNSAQNTHLKRRVVLLRLNQNRLQAEVSRLQARIEILEDQLPKDSDAEPEEGDDNNPG